MLRVHQVRAADGDPRGLLWVLDEEMATPASCENRALERVCQYYSNMGKNTATQRLRLPACENASSLLHTTY